MITTVEKTALIKVGRTALAWPMTLTLTYNLQSPVSYGHGLLTWKSSRSTVSRFRKLSGNKRTERRTRTEVIASPSSLISCTLLLFSLMNNDTQNGTTLTFFLNILAYFVIRAILPSIRCRNPSASVKNTKRAPSKTSRWPWYPDKRRRSVAHYKTL